MKKIVLGALALLAGSVVFAQQKIIAQKEMLGTFDVDDSHFYFVQGADDFMGHPLGPYIDSDGEILFMTEVYNSLNKSDFKIVNGKIIDLDNFNTDPFRANNVGRFHPCSNGYCDYRFVIKDDFFIKLSDEEAKKLKEKSGGYKLKSGHTIRFFYPGLEEDMNIDHVWFYIYRDDGVVETQVKIPWGMLETGEFDYSTSFALGNWGELYVMLPPEPVFKTVKLPGGGGDYAVKPVHESGKVELFCIRNYLKLFGILNDDYIRLRKGPSTSSENLGSYMKGTGFKIIETGKVKETIGGQTDVWYKVRLLDGTEGYFFGAFVHNLYDGPGTPIPWPNVKD